MAGKMTVMRLSAIIFMAAGLTAMTVSARPSGDRVEFGEYFTDRTLRMDYVHAGNSRGDSFYFRELIEEPYWGGSKSGLIDTTFYGNYYLNVYDLASDRLIYSRGFSSLFFEWMATPEADFSDNAMDESVVMPFPKGPVRVEICRRDGKGRFVPAFRKEIDPESCFISRERRAVYPVYDVKYSGAPEHKVDVVIIPEGYTADEMDKFREDCRTFVDGIMSFSPYRENADRFNFRAVLAPSEESGTDIPAENCWKRTLLNSSFYTFNSERYLMTTDFVRVRDVAANAPYDIIYVIVNSQKYGGGAIYNHYGMSIAGNAHSAKVYVHEFSHLFPGLGDEYVGTTSYNDLYPTGIEPWEPNLTTLRDFGSKWKDMLPEGTAVPTEPDTDNPDKLGVFEGGGYASKGIYRPRLDCLMNSFRVDDFCPVCSRAIIRQIDFYCR